PYHRGRRLKFYYTAQIQTAPPTFAVVANDPQAVHFSYQRYLVNQFREGLGLDRVPVRLFFREKKRRTAK
ncbi:MAG: ribosome biogenesis GTPase Der, partial [Desulfobulbaceae bacterium]|nr:ribosome biogenesis GTPase Der [Desulfobulbaceae bacterium]